VSHATGGGRHAPYGSARCRHARRYEAPARPLQQKGSQVKRLVVVKILKSRRAAPAEMHMRTEPCSEERKPTVLYHPAAKMAKSRVTPRLARNSNTDEMFTENS